MKAINHFLFEFLKHNRTKKKIKDILRYHKNKNPGVKLVKVTTTRWYEIPVYTSTPVPELLEEWFKKYPINRSHAGRDGSLLIEYFNNNAKIVKHI